MRYYKIIPMEPTDGREIIDTFTFADGSQLSIRATGEMAAKRYYELLPALEGVSQPVVEMPVFKELEQ